MAAFRKLILGVAAATVFAGLTSAQTSFQCVANAGVPPTVRAEGLTELVGDVSLNCTGGTPTAAGIVIPSSNVTVFLNTNITSRILSTSQGTWSEAIILIDEPHSPTNPFTQLLACGDGNAPEVVGSPGVCQIVGVGPKGLDGINPPVGTNGPYNGTLSRPNVFQARQGVGQIGTTANAVTWNGIPFDAPGTTGQRTIRITNVRANANQLGTSSTLIPTTITMYISVTGSNQVSINNPTQTVAFIQVGLVSSVFDSDTFQQCVSRNAGGGTGPNTFSNSFGGVVTDFVIRLREGFQSAFKRRNLNFTGYSATQSALPNNNASTTNPGGDLNQNVPGAVYNTESAFENLGSGAEPPGLNPPTGSNFSVGIQGSAFPTIHGLNNAGVANSGTRLMLTFTNVVTSTNLYVPTVVRLFNQLSGAVTGVAVLTSTAGDGSGGFSAVTSNGGAIGQCLASSGTSCARAVVSTGLAQVSVFNGSGMAVYEVLFSDAFSPEELDIPVALAYQANPTSNLPTPGSQTTVTASFAPLSTVGTASGGDPIPRFAPGAAARNLYIIQKCSCNLLFPFVTNQLGYDTGIAIANTSLDTGTGFGTTPQAGIVTLNYYCGATGCTSPPQAATTSNVPAGAQLTFTLSGGGNYGIQATPGFQGYIIAQAQFQFCHAYAFITAQGSLPTSAGANTGYIALEMDAALPTRTGNASEVLGH